MGRKALGFRPAFYSYYFLPAAFGFLASARILIVDYRGRAYNRPRLLF